MPQNIPTKIDLLINNKVYMADPTPQKAYVGRLQKKKGVSAVGYRLLVETGDSINPEDVHLYGQDYQRLAPYNGMKVRITGKLVSGTVRGNPFAYILPGWLEVVPPPGEKPTVKVLKVLARGPWRLGTKPDPVQLVIRSAKELALSHGIRAGQAEDYPAETRAVGEAARLFKVENIDWKTQMVIVVSGGAKPTSGYSVEITGLDIQNDVLTVHWRLNSPKPGDFVAQSATDPAQAVLTERFDGKVVFLQAPKPKGIGK